MSLKPLILLLGFLPYFNKVFSQHVDEGAYNDWDFGPNGVYGNLPLKQLNDRGYYKIEKIDSQLVKVKHFNPSGIIINTASLFFVRGIINRIEEMSQWGGNVRI
jgi:hypothetical protein